MVVSISLVISTVSNWIGSQPAQAVTNCGSGLKLTAAFVSIPFDSEIGVSINTPGGVIASVSIMGLNGFNPRQNTIYDVTNISGGFNVLADVLNTAGGGATTVYVVVGVCT
jgi:hypothetical protein